MYWWRPIVWKSLGAIAYEYESATETMLSVARKEGLKKALELIRPLLEEFYEGAAAETIVPRDRLHSMMPRSTSAVERGGILKSLEAGSPDRRVDDSVQVLTGREHGDLHARNVLIGKRTPILIDFEHYRGQKELGVPLFDLAKMMVDLTVWKVARLKFDDLLSGQAIFDAQVADIVDIFLIDKKNGPTEDERSLFGGAAATLLARYSEYDDVPIDRRNEISAALSRLQ
jgi:Ternary complex associated domain 9